MCTEGIRPAASASAGPETQALELGIAALAPQPEACWRELSRSTRSLGSLSQVATLLDGAPPNARWVAVLRSETANSGKQAKHSYAALSLARPSASASQLYAVLPAQWLELLSP